VTAVQTHTVKLYDGFPPGTGVITINDDNTFVLQKIDPTTGAPLATIFNTPINQMNVRGSASAMRFRVGAVTKRVDFSLGSELVRGFGGLAGEIAGGVMVGKSGVADVAKALRAGGAQVRYWSYWRRIGMIWLIVIGFFVVFFGIIFLAALGSH
jgi:hypothetical protein